MSDFRSFKAESKKDWGTHEPGPITMERIENGALLRIADAVEKMATNYSQLIEERDRWKRWYESSQLSVGRLRRQGYALRGVITRQRKKAASAPPQDPNTV